MNHKKFIKYYIFGISFFLISLTTSLLIKQFFGSYFYPHNNYFAYALICGALFTGCTLLVHLFSFITSKINLSGKKINLALKIIAIFQIVYFSFLGIASNKFAIVNRINLERIETRKLIENLYTIGIFIAIISTISFFTYLVRIKKLSIIYLNLFFYFIFSFLGIMVILFDDKYVHIGYKGDMAGLIYPIYFVIVLAYVFVFTIILSVYKLIEHYKVSRIK